MSLFDFLEIFSYQVFEEPYFYFWIRLIIQAMQIMDPETEPDLERMTCVLLDYYAGKPVASEEVTNIRREMAITRKAAFGSKNPSPIVKKYRCLHLIAGTKEWIASDEQHFYKWVEAVWFAFEVLDLTETQQQQVIQMMISSMIEQGIQVQFTPRID